MDSLTGLLIGCIIALLFMLMSSSTVVSPMDGNGYIVERNLKSPSSAAFAMSVLRQRIVFLLSHLKRKYPNDKVTRKLLKHFNPDHIAEITPNNGFGYTSYTLDKGKLMRFCLRNKETMDVHELDELTFVAYHELAHIGDWDANHGVAFWQMFKFILQEAFRAGIYTPVNYSVNPIKYCGMKVSYNPYYDVQLQAYAPV